MYLFVLNNSILERTTTNAFAACQAQNETKFISVSPLVC